MRFQPSEKAVRESISSTRGKHWKQKISGIAPAITQSATTKAGTNEYDEGSVIGTVASYETIRDLYVTSGRFLKQPDIDNRSYVAVIGVDVADELFESRDVVGNSFRMDGYDFTVVGLLEEEGSSSTGSNDNQIIIPFTLAERIFFTPGITTFYASASSSNDVATAEAVLTGYMDEKFPDSSTDTASSSQTASRASGRNSSTNNDTSNSDYRIYNQTDMLDTLDSTISTLTLMLGGIAAISLLVGGIGIMNIMLVSVSERTREIGIRKAVGAKRRNILTQFLIEALVVCLLGGVLGLIFSFALMQVLGPMLDMTLTLMPGVAELAIGFSLVVGLIFGLYPANKASKLQPIEALRYDG